jgi:alcohol dehydrogenase class IV
VLDTVLQPLASAGVDFEVFDEIEPNPRDTTIVSGGQAMRDARANVVIGLGGGSPMDAAKAIAVVAVNDGPLESYCGAGADPWPMPPAPIIAIPTTAGTGAEVSGAAMINLVAESRKTDIFGPSILPVTAILDPRLTVGLPPHLTAWTGLDALSHALESYVGPYANPITDALAEKAIGLVADNLRRAYSNGHDLNSRGSMLVASTMAILAYAGLGVVHSMAQTLGGYYDAPHGLSIAACMPIGVAYNLPAAATRYARVAQLLGTDTRGMTTEAAAESVVPALRSFLDDLDVSQDLGALGLREEDIPELANLAMRDDSTSTNPRPLDEQAFMYLFRKGLDG